MSLSQLPSALILNVGQDPELLRTRSLILRAQGYGVESCSIEEAIHRFRACDFDLVLLCHSVPRRERERLILLIRDYDGSTPVLFVAAASADCPDRLANASSRSDPRELLQSIRDVLSVRLTLRGDISPRPQ